MRGLISVLAMLVGACAAQDATSIDEFAVEEASLLVFRVPGFEGERLDVRVDGGDTASAIRVHGELAVVIPVREGGVAQVDVFDRNREVIGRAKLEVRPLTGLVIERYDAGRIPVTVSTFDVRITRDDPIELGGPTRLHADFVTPSGERITIRDLAWTLHDREIGAFEIDPRNPRDVIFTQRIDSPVLIDICTESEKICWGGTLPPRNYAGVIRRTGMITTDVSLSGVASGDFTVVLRFLPQYPRSYEGPLLSNNTLAGVNALGVSIGDDTTMGHAVAITLRIGQTITRYELANFDHGVDAYTWASSHPTNAPTPATNQWHHLALVGTGSTLKLYIDGTERLSDQNTRASLPTAPLGGFLTIGRRPPALNEHEVQFYGLVDDLAVFSSAKSDNDIAWLNNDRTITGSEPDLVRAVTFDGPDSRPFIGQPNYARESWTHLVSSSRNATLDAAALPLPFQHQTYVLPFVFPEVWAVGQQFANNGTHRNRAAFSWDFIRVPAGTPPTPSFSPDSYGARILSMISGSVATFGTYSATGDDWLDVLSSSAQAEFGFFHHVKPNSERFAAGHAVDSNTVVAQSEYNLHVGGAENVFSSAVGHLSMPFAFSDYDVSRDYGVTWQYVPIGMPTIGEWVRRHTPNGVLYDPRCLAAPPWQQQLYGC